MFSGCGGLDFGLTKAGFEVVWANDFDSDACETYRKNIGEIHCGDINQIPTPNIKNLDLLVSGFPCQPFSSAGNRKGVKDHRGHYYQKTLDYIAQLKPKAVLIENVRGLLSAKLDDSLLIDYMVNDLEDKGYTVRYHLLNFSHFGVPQSRIRVILIALKNGNYINSVFPEVVTGVDLSISKTLAGLNNKVPNHNEFMKLNPQALELGQHVPEGGSWKDIPTRLLPERLKKIRSDMKAYGSPVIYRRCSRNSVMSTVTAAFKPEIAAVWHPIHNRIYSVREVARFQSFPDSFVFLGRSIKSKYQQLGNAVPPQIGYLFGKHIIACLNGHPIKHKNTGIALNDLKVNKQLEFEDLAA